MERKVLKFSDGSVIAYKEDQAEVTIPISPTESYEIVFNDNVWCGHFPQGVNVSSAKFKDILSLVLKDIEKSHGPLTNICVLNVDERDPYEYMY